MSLQSLETVLLEMPARPIACTSSSTRRVDTPPIQASWMTATSALSLVFRGSGDGAQEVALAALLQHLRQWQSVLGHRVSSSFRVGLATPPRTADPMTTSA